jgi:uncharacterized protein YbaP (TraB family)
MVRKLSLFFIFLNTFVISAQTNSLEDALLWEITGKNLKSPSFLYGTIHVIPKDDFFFTPEMEKAFMSSEELVMELDMDISTEMQMQMMRDMLLPDGKSLSNYMDKKSFEQYMSYLKDSLKLSAVNLFLLPKIKPLFSFSLILQDLIKHPVSYEAYFQKLAKKYKMKSSGLETLQEQMDLINKIPIQEQVDLIMDTTDHKADFMNEYYEMIDLYKKQRIDKLHEQTDDEKLIRKYSDQLLTGRNQYWVSVLEQKMKEHSCFIAVGAGHLSGDAGLIVLLRNMGYQVKAIDVFKK